MDAHERFRAPYFIAATQLAWAQFLTDRGRPEQQTRADAMLAQALTISREYGFAGLERKADALATSI